MSWIQKLYETYQQCAHGAIALDVPGSLEPICHTSQLAQIEIRIDGNGVFRGADVVNKTEGVTLVPCTEASVGRTGKQPASHPLCDKLQYLAADFRQFGGAVTSGFAASSVEPHHGYLQNLARWAESDFSHPKVQAIHAYLARGNVIADLVAARILHTETLDGEAVLLKAWRGEKAEAPKIFGVMANGSAPQDAFVRWRVEIPGEVLPETWMDQGLVDAWIGFYLSENTSQGLCLASGDTVLLAQQHAAKLRHGADKAKLISANDTTGFTFRGRFGDARQACAVGFEVSQKAHNALRWLIRRQAFRNGDQVVVAWAVTGKRIPDPLKNSAALFDDEEEEAVAEANKDADQHANAEGAPPSATEAPNPHGAGDAGQAFGLRLARLLSGYKSDLGSRNEIVVMALDSATTGRMAITYYREFDFPEFIQRIEAWHRRYAWRQDFSKDKKFIGAPSPKDIAEACYGTRLDDKLRKSAIERLLPVIMDGAKLPDDFVAATVRRAMNRVGLDHWEWEKCLGIACALYKGNHIERNYQMALESDRKSRDYLYGRLLAIADNIEKFALDKANETRETSAARLMQRFADQPCETWKGIVLKLAPYKARLRLIAPGFLHARETLMDEVVALCQFDDFISSRKLTGEFLLGYHCQRHALMQNAEPKSAAGDNAESTTLNDENEDNKEAS